MHKQKYECQCRDATVLWCREVIGLGIFYSFVSQRGEYKVFGLRMDKVTRQRCIWEKKCKTQHHLNEHTLSVAAYSNWGLNFVWIWPNIYYYIVWNFGVFVLNLTGGVYSCNTTTLYEKRSYDTV